MKKSYHKIIFLLISIVAAATLSGCTSDKTVRNYLQALLDASYKNDAAIFVDMKLGSEEEAQALYDRGIDTGVRGCLQQTWRGGCLQGIVSSGVYGHAWKSPVYR